jgi:hypothetical protein
MTQTLLLQIAVSADLFHTPTGVAYADILSTGKRETWPIRSERFRWWLRGNYYDATGMAPSAGAIRSVLDLLEARAQFDGPERAVNVRVAEQAGRIYLDLETSVGAPSKLVPTGGVSSVTHRCAFADQPACSQFRLPSGEDRLICLRRSSTCRPKTISSWSLCGSWRRCDRVVPILRW